MQQKTIGYMAGLMDAEGCFIIGRSFRKASNCYNYFAQIIFTNTNPDLLKWITKHFGGVCKKRKIVSGNKQAYDWIVSNQKHALSFLSIIEPYLFVKKEEAQLLKQYYALNGKEVPEERESLYKQSRLLKWNKSSVTTDTSNVSNAYLAGFFDGDGGLRSPYTLHVTNTHKGVVELYRQIYGGSFHEYENSNPKQNDYFRWALGNKEKSILVMLAWLPYLIDKRERVHKALLKAGTKIQSELTSDCKRELTETLIS
jgi:hypothetical protein